MITRSLVQPTYQNQRVVREVVTTTTTSSKGNSLNNNLSELDTLLQDLSNAHYSATNSSYAERRGQSKATRKLFYVYVGIQAMTEFFLFL